MATKKPKAEKTAATEEHPFTVDGEPFDIMPPTKRIDAVDCPVCGAQVVAGIPCPVDGNVTEKP